jgi:hypothetical protein
MLRRVVVSVALVLTLVAMVACGSDDTDGARPTTPAGPAAQGRQICREIAAAIPKYRIYRWTGDRPEDLAGITPEPSLKLLGDCDAVVDSHGIDVTDNDGWQYYIGDSTFPAKATADKCAYLLWNAHIQEGSFDAVVIKNVVAVAVEGPGSGPSAADIARVFHGRVQHCSRTLAADGPPF